MTAFGQIVPEGHILVDGVRYDLARDADGNLRQKVGFEWRYAAQSMPEHAKKAAISQQHPMYLPSQNDEVLAELARLRKNTHVFADQVHQTPARLKIKQKLVTTWAEEARTS